MNPDELSFDRFEILLAKMFAARSDDAARQIFHKLKSIWDHYDSTGQRDALNELSDLTAIIYQKVIAQEDEWLSKKTKLYYLVSFFTHDRATDLAQKLTDQAESKKEHGPENPPETSLLVMALGCAAAVASTSLASKFLESVTEKQEEVVR